MSETLTTPPVDLAAWAGTPEHPVPAAARAPEPFAPAAEHPGLPFAAPAPRAPRRALSITSLVLGGIGVVGCWIPVVNTSSIAFGVGGLGLGIPALVLARRGRQGAEGLAVTGVVLSALTIVVAVVADVLFGLAVAASAESASVTPAQPVPATATSASTSASTSGSTSGSALGLGSPAVVGDCSVAVAVAGVEQDADGLMAMEDPAAGPAAGQYVLASLDVTYQGAEGGDAWTDLSTAFLGADGVPYDELDCAAVPADSPTYLPVLETGDSASCSLCLDVPADAVAGGGVVVHEEGSVAAEPVVWSAG